MNKKFKELRAVAVKEISDFCDEGEWEDAVTPETIIEVLEALEEKDQRIAELERRLQQPIKLKNEYYSPSLKYPNRMELNSNGAFMVALDVTDAIRAAGFTV